MRRWRRACLCDGDKNRSMVLDIKSVCFGVVLYGVAIGWLTGFQ